ncbi:MAG: hypothetical protein WDN49_18845 [Acetobacteraceae bacterium]
MQPPPEPPRPEPPPPILVSPVINVPAGPAPTVIVPSPPTSFWRVWLPVLVAAFLAGISASIAATSAWLAWRNQVFGFAKDAAAIARDVRNRQSAAALVAFENSVARPVGMALDLVERLTLELGRLRPVAEPPQLRAGWLRRQAAGPQPPAAVSAHVAALEQYGAGLIADHSHGVRLCREADGALAAARTPVFARTFSAARLDDLLLAAADEALSPTPHAARGTAYDTASGAIVQLKIDLRRVLETERSIEAARWLGTLDADPFFIEVQHWLPRRLRSPAP